MSRIGRQPVEIPEGVTVTINDRDVVVKGSKGELSIQVANGVSVTQEDTVLNISVKDEQTQGALWGLSRALVANMIVGVTEGFEKKLEITGVGYKAQAQGKKLVLSLGFSHPVEIEVPEGIEVTVDEMIISVKGINKALVGQVAANIRAKRPVEPYKGKGIKYIDEHVRRKVGKRVVATEGA